MHFSGLIPTPHYNRGRQALRDITHTGSWKRGIPPNIIMKKALAVPHIASTANAGPILFYLGNPLIALSDGEKKNEERKEEKK